MSSTESSGKAGKLLRATLGLVVVAAATGVASHAMGLWQINDPQDPPAPVRAVAEPVAVSGRTVTVLAGGSILPTPELRDQARRDGGGTRPDFAAVLAGARPAVSAADLALCHLDAPLRRGNGIYLGDPELARAIADAGFDGCSTAAAHAFDQGTAGLTATLDALEKAKVGHSGTYRSEDQSGSPRLYTADGVKIAHLSYTLGLNGQKVPPGREWAVARPTVEKIRDDAREARDAGATIVVVSVDWGSLGENEPDVDQQTLARSIATMRNVDIVFGHGAHVVQPVERIGDKWIIYGLGDLASRHPQPVNGNREGSMMRVIFAPAGEKGRWKVAAVEALPTFIDLNPHIRLIDLEQALASPALPAGRREIYEAAATRIQSHLLNRGGGVSTFYVRGVGR
ncbi:CapA family protein [Paractinoplanes hotanensis]|uniref:CapA family protein n=1 Tax=Paractinoplanes hotanensis TaxID=2906497 RepID=A0ABT0Y056_9ACTN|nr:CapA family protein [Actinoplanes hotanensis]MCM4079418.1 CapA family protein [Actinoplanes hotanensis]